MALPLFNIGGLASGLDTNAIIESVLAVERIPINQLQARRATYEAKDQAWTDINTKFSAIRTALSAIDSLNDLNKFALASSSNEMAVVATATGAATPGSLAFIVDQLAMTHQVVSTTNFTSGDDVVSAGDFTITVDGVDYTATSDGTTTLNEIAQQINAIDDLDVTAQVITVDETTFKLYLTADDTGSATAFTTSASIAELGSTSIVQQGTDALITLGSGPGALTLTRTSNIVTDLVPGVSMELKEVTTNPVSVSVSRDTEAMVEAAKLLVDEINVALSTLGELTAYNADAEVGGVLVGDSTARSLIFDLRGSISGIVNQNAGDYPIAASIGISLTREGTFEFDETKLRSALDADFDAVVDLLLESGSAIDSRLSFSSAQSTTLEGDYEVVITEAGTKATATSAVYLPPASNTTFQIIVGATSVDVNVLQNDDISTALAAINGALTAAGITSVSASQVTVAPDDFIELTATSYGSATTFQVIGDPFGLAGSYLGTDVVGTIGGAAATGLGQLLTADAGDPEGLAVSVAATAADVSGAGGSLSLGEIMFRQGIFGEIDRRIGQAEGSSGRIARARDLWQAQMDIVDDRIDVLEDRIERKEALLIRQFAGLEVAMSTLSSQAAWLSAQIGQLSGSGSGT